MCLYLERWLGTRGKGPRSHLVGMVGVLLVVGVLVGVVSSQQQNMNVREEVL